MLYGVATAHVSIFTANERLVVQNSVVPPWNIASVDAHGERDRRVCFHQRSFSRSRFAGVMRSLVAVCIILTARTPDQTYRHADADFHNSGRCCFGSRIEHSTRR